MGKHAPSAEMIAWWACTDASEWMKRTWGRAQIYGSIWGVYGLIYWFMSDHDFSFLLTLVAMVRGK
jgi:hypothetical protein